LLFLDNTKKITLIFVLLLFGCSVFAASTTEDPIDIYGGARSLAMGGGFIAIADDPNTLFSNPAGLAGLQSWATTGTYIYIPHTDSYYTITGGGMTTNFGNIGLGYIGSGISQIEVGNNQYTDYTDSLLFLTYATPIGRFSPVFQNVYAGLNFKLYNKGFDGGLSQYATGMNVDLGVKYYPYNWITLGFTRRNVVPFNWGGYVTWDTGTKEDLPGNTYIGGAMRYFDGRGIIALEAEFPYSSEMPVLYHLGAEWKAMPAIAFRLGADQKIHSFNANQTTTTNPTFGVGLNYWGYRIDYAYHPYYSDFSESVASTITISFVDPKTYKLKAVVKKKVVSSGDLQTVIVEAPKSNHKIEALMPDGKKINLKYKENGRDVHEWVGEWKVPGKMSGKGFVAKIYQTDQDYNVWETETNRFDIVSTGKIVVLSPADKSILYPENTTVKGEVVFGEIDKLMVNKKQAVITAKNKFSSKVDLILGKNPINIKVLGKTGNDLEKILLRVLRLQTFTDLTKDYWAKLPVEQLATLGIINGYPDGTFKPEGTINRAELTAMIVRLLGGDPGALDKASFPDVPKKLWSYNFIEQGVAEGIVTGYPDGTFRPDAPINRVEGVSIIARFANLPSSLTKELTFKDVPKSHWAFDTVNTAYQVGLLDHLGENFNPKEELSRGEAAGILARTGYVKKKINKLMDFNSGYK
jgi:S-layer homology domain/Glucodextranase, domain B